MDGASANDTAASLLNPRQLRWLKFAVVAMGIAIIVGLLAVFVQIARLASRSPPASAVAGAASVSRGGVPTDITLPLPAGARVRSWQLQATRLAVEYESPAMGSDAVPQTILAVIDLPSGTIVSRVHITAGAGK